MNIIFVGCGNMGSAIVSGMLKSPDFNAEQISTVLPPLSPDILKVQNSLKIRIYNELPKNKDFDIIFFAVKPQTLPSILPIYKEALRGKRAIIISIVAGKSAAYFREFFPNAKIVRTMPNLNAMYGKGSTVGIYDKALTSNEKETIEKIFTSIGHFYWSEDESVMDAVTAISGSGPAYYFAFTEYLTAAAEKIGIPKALAKNLAEETFIGAAEVLSKANKSPAELRAAVTSKGGTTEAALESFNKEDAFSKLIQNAVTSAKNRAKELSE